MKALLWILLASCCGLSARAQTPLGPAVQAEQVVVQETPVPSDAGGVTQVQWDPAISAPLSAWDALSRETANLHVSEGGAGGYGSLFTLRGLTNTPYFSDPAVTVYFGDIPLASGYSYPTGLSGFDHATVYRGPQGTNFGRATDGGVIVFSPLDLLTGGSAAPTSAAEISAGYGNYDSRHALVEAEGQSADAAAINAQVAAGYDKRSGYITNRQLGISVDGQEDESVSARLRVRPSAQAEFTLELLDSRSRSGAEPLVPLGGPLFSVSRASEGETDLDSMGAALKGKITLAGAGTLTTTTSFTDWRMNPYEDFLVLPPPLDSEIVQDQKSWNEELRLDLGKASFLRSHAGFWLSHTGTTNYVDRKIPGLFPIEVSSFEESSRTGAVFGEADLSLAPSWQLSLGARAETTQRDFTRNEAVPVPGLGYVGAGRYDGVLPKAALDWTGAEDRHFEAAVAWSLRPGGYASYTDKPALIPFAAERVTAYSLGWDEAYDHHRVQWAVDGFYNQISNYQIERSFSSTDYFVATAPRARSVGAEAEGRWHPAAGWTMSASLGWTDTTLTRYLAPLTGQNLAGRQAPYVPLYNGSLEAAYRPGRGWFASAQLTAVGRIYYDEMESPAFEQHPYALLSSRVGYETGKWSLTAYGENLTGRSYYQLIIPGVNSANPGAPRTYGLDAAWRF